MLCCTTAWGICFRPVWVDLDTDDAFIDRHVFYDGKYLGAELLTITFRDFSQPLWMDATARAVMLENSFR